MTGAAGLGQVGYNEAMTNIILIPVALLVAYFLAFLIRKHICYFIWLAREAFRFRAAWQIEMVQCCMVFTVTGVLFGLLCWDVGFILGVVGYE